MEQALEEARAAVARGEVPVGAVLVDGATGEVVAAAGNRTRELADPTAHAEMVVLREAAARLGAPRLPGCDLYVTLEPCAMCAGAISLARLRRLYFAATTQIGPASSTGRGSSTTPPATTSRKWWAAWRRPKRPSFSREFSRRGGSGVRQDSSPLSSSANLLLSSGSRFATTSQTICKSTPM